MGGLPKEININRKFEFAMETRAINRQTPKTGAIQKETEKEILIGFIKDDFENKKEIFIAPEEEEGI